MYSGTLTFKVFVYTNSSSIYICTLMDFFSCIQLVWPGGVSLHCTIATCTVYVNQSQQSYADDYAVCGFA